MQRQARIVRFWLLFAALVLMGLWHPAVWFASVPLFFFPSCPCCPSCCTSCAEGTEPSGGFQFEIAGVTSGFCGGDCDEYNGTWVAATCFAPCEWRSDISPSICGHDFVSFRVIGGGSPVFKADFRGGFIGSFTEWYESRSGGSEEDCDLEAHSLTNNGSNVGCTAQVASSTCEVTAL